MQPFFRPNVPESIVQPMPMILNTNPAPLGFTSRKPPSKAKKRKVRKTASDSRRRNRK